MIKKIKLILGIIWFGTLQVIAMFALIILGSMPFEKINIFAGILVIFAVWFFGSIQYMLIDEYHKEKLRIRKCH